MVEKLLFNLSNFHQQRFPFSLKLIQYMIENADAEVKQKLDRSCKYFYKEAPYLIIDTLEITEEKQRMENETSGGCIDFIDDDQIQIFLMNTSNIWVTKKVDIALRQILDFRGNNIDVQLFEKIIRSDAKEISIYNMYLPFFDYKLLTNSRKVEYLDLSASIISGFDKTFVPLEDVLALVPNARVIRMFACHITSDTMEKLLEIPWKNKVTEFSLNNVDGPLCPILFFKFVKKHIDAQGSFHVHFKNETDSFQKLYNQMVIESGEKMPTIGNVAPIEKKQSRMQKVLSWMASFASKIIHCEFSLPFKKPSAPKQLTKVTFNDENAERQYTAFPYPHMCYIRENADAETWKKLEQTCKFFCEKNPYVMVDDFHVGKDNKITLMVDNKTVIFNNEMEMRIIGKPLWITHSVEKSGKGGLYKNDRVDAIKILTGAFVYSKDAFIRLTKSGKVKDWNSIDGIFKNNGKVISLIELLVHLPNVEIFRARIHGIQPHYPNEPILLPQSNKIKYVEIIFLEDAILADSLFDVLKTSFAPKAMVKIDLCRLIDEMNVEEFKAQMKAKLDTWKPQIDKPTFKIFS